MTAAPLTGTAGPAISPSSRGSVFERVMRALDDSPSQTIASSDQKDLLALQAAVYREAERVEIATRVLDQTVSAVKTILQTRL